MDGTANRFVVDRLVTRSVQAPTVQRSLWTVESATLGSEQDAQLDVHMDRPALWRVLSASERGPLGYPNGYQIRPGHGAISTVDRRDPMQMTAGFARHQLWVTRQSDAEWLAAGDYPVARRDEGGLPVWSRANRKIQDEDLVVWYTMGMHHVPRAEDWPVMPTVWHELEIRPFDFFARNPALDLPRR